ncbi:U3-containing 90S pre-ribosomal complex subunit-domain containing protein [Phialemonium atrogriseum]|uniref:U3-containing 90S pre-ribosomal complex subunit-domain containing protein n=1 Tax=Phialemonium atrogriseum TaxID=1093897 RepID=A0AAJ0C269_9PEZI|nr:U3-containing 90S pre-ribosomal complex subunit-domain containing protein [Phialemonium atrogriseum]KAK1768785.1 U3-containing 90S pre-ribosomal complex subunit-domain containing protein [Phialemonium atrogriseum]
MATAEKSRKRPSKDEGGGSKKKRRRAQEDDADIDTQAGLNKAFERMDGQLLADHLAQKTRRFGTDLSSIELSDLYISANFIKDTTSWAKPRTLENLPDFLEAFVEDPKELGAAPKDKGAPHTIVVTGAGLRAAELVRSLRKFQTKGTPVAKLFAKHIKLEEAVSFLSKARTGIAVGTPVRLMDLLDNGALSVEHLRRVVIDASHVDQKKRGVMDSGDTMIPLARWLSRKEFKERYADPESPVDLMFY